MILIARTDEGATRRGKPSFEERDGLCGVICYGAQIDVR